ncbi:hypothetical protein [Janibacter alittae]|uniref:Uncharacterized protein n=1 Tax=Janibacter alittae TaxID=3115209 RepID=A0ABZ2MLF8_9MICO
MDPTPNRVEVHLPTHGEARDTGGQDFTAHTARWVAFTADTGFWLIVFVVGYGHHSDREYPYFVESPHTREPVPAWLPRPPVWFGSAVDQMRASCASPATT